MSTFTNACGWRAGALAALLTAAHLGCAEDAPSRTPAARFDSSGVEVVQNFSDAWSTSQEWHVSPNPALTVGGGHGIPEQELFNVRGAIRLPGGDILVADAGNHRLRIYASTGEHVRDLGRRGSGPGEFVALSRVWRYRRDSVLTFDLQGLRLSVFSGDGTFGRSFTLQSTSEVPLPIPVDVFLDGSILVRAGISALTHQQLGLVRTTMMLGEWSATGRFVQSLGSFPGRELYFFASERGPFPNTPLFHRKSEALTWRDRFVVASNESYELLVYSRDQRLNQIIRKEHPLTAPSPEDVAKLTELVLMTARDEAMHREMAAELQKMPIHSTLPAFGWPALPENFARRAVLADAEGYVWVLEYRLPASRPLRWTVFTPEGVMLGTVQVPDDLEIFEIGVDYVLGLERNELGIETVSLYPLTRSGQDELATTR